MFSEGVNLKKDSWYIKLLGFMWGAKYTDFKNLCPLFWSIIGSLVLFPLWLVWKLLSFIPKIGNLIGWDLVKRPIMLAGKLAVSILFSYSLACLINSIISNIYYSIKFKYFVEFLVPSLIIPVLSLVGMFGLFYFLKGVGKFIEKVNKNKKEIKKAVKPCRFLIDPFMYLLKFFLSIIYIVLKILEIPISILKLVGNMIVAVYKKSCPLINWK